MDRRKTSLPFPFPDEDTGLTPALRDQIGALAEQIDTHRKRQQAAHPGLTLTGMYNVHEALRQAQGERGGVENERVLTTKEKTIHTQGLVGVLKDLHDELDAAVLQAYGLLANPGKDALLTHLVALNAQRAQEEKTGLIRWLRPEFQNPAAANALQNSEHIAPVFAAQVRCPSKCALSPSYSQAPPPRSPWFTLKPISRAKARGKKACPAFWKRWRPWGGHGVRRTDGGREEASAVRRYKCYSVKPTYLLPQRPLCAAKPVTPHHS